MNHLYRVNLNLLIALDILLQEKNVTRAAKKIHLSQAAMSNNLKQLRSLFKDQLLIQEKNKMVLTSYAQELQLKLHKILEELEGIIKGTPFFDPAICNRMFKIGMSDHIAALVLPTLISILPRQAPNIKINTLSLTQMYKAEPFEKEVYDIGIGRTAPLPTFIQKKLLIRENYVLILSTTHPLAKKEKLTLSDFNACKHIAYRTENTEFPSLLVQALEAKGGKRNAILYLPYLDTVFRLIEKSNDHIATVVESAATLLAEKYNVLFKPFPIELPAIEIYMAWHHRFDNDPAHQWIRNQIIDIFTKI